ERERRAPAPLALHPDPAAVQLYELPAKGQPQPCSLGPLVRRPPLTELLEDGSLALWGNAPTCIGHRDLGRAVHKSRAHLHPAAFWSELQGVREEVQEDLLDLTLVAANLTQAC